MSWYDGLYENDPSTDNPFGREDLVRGASPLLAEFLRQGGVLSAFPRLEAEHKARRQLQAAMDRALGDGTAALCASSRPFAAS